MKLCPACRKPFSSQAWTCPRCGHRPRRVGGFPSFLKGTRGEKGGFPADGFDRLVKLEADNFWFRSRNRMILWALGKYFPRAASFLEVGCGNGFVLQAVERDHPDWELTGGEMFLRGLAYSSRRLQKAQLLLMDACAIPFRGEFDVVGAFDVLEHVPDDRKALAQMHRAAAAGGGLLLTVPQHRFLWSYSDEFARHVRRYEKGELVRKVERAGFKVMAALSFVSVLLPLMMAARKVQGKNQADYDPKGEMEIHPLVNFTLEKALDLERLLIRCGARFPWGGSLMVAARKN